MKAAEMEKRMEFNGKCTLLYETTNRTHTKLDSSIVVCISIPNFMRTSTHANRKNDGTLCTVHCIRCSNKRHPYEADTSYVCVLVFVGIYNCVLYSQYAAMKYINH